MLEFVVSCFISGVVFYIGYVIGRESVWKILSEKYIVLPKGSYYCNYDGKIVRKGDK